MQNEVLIYTAASWFRLQVSLYGIGERTIKMFRLEHLASLPDAHQIGWRQAVSEAQPLLYGKCKLLPCPVHRTCSEETTHETSRHRKACCKSNSMTPWPSILVASLLKSGITPQLSFVTLPLFPGPST